MKKILFTICICWLSFTIKAQSDSSYVDFGVNVIRLVNLGMGNSQLNYDIWNPYLFTADAHYKRIGLRTGIGMRSVTNKELPTASNGLTTFEMDTSRVDFRIGLNYDIHLHNRWTCKVGVDYFIANETKRNAAEFTNEDDVQIETEHKIERNEKGFSPFLYVQYHITPRVSLGTELLWRISSYTSSDTDLSNLNDASIERKYEGTRRSIMGPTALFLNVRF